MSERYKQVKLYDDFKFCPTCPVDILKGAIYIDTVTNNSVFQLKFVNMQDKKIKAIYVSVAGSNDLGQEFQNKEYQYLDLNVNKGQEFGTEQLKELDNNTIRNINVTINKIIYSDNSIWENTNNTYYDRTDLKEIDNNLLYIANKKINEQGIIVNKIYYSKQYENYWSCVCGTFNSNNNEECYKCGGSKEKIITQFNQKYLENEQKNNIEYEKIQKEIKKNKTKKHLQIFGKIIGILLAIFLLIGIIFYNVKTVDVQVNMKKDITTLGEELIKIQIEEICNTKEIQYVSKDEALQIMKDKLGEDLLKNYEGENNIFSSSYKFKVKLKDSSRVKKIISNITGVESVSVEKILLNKLVEITD